MRRAALDDVVLSSLGFIAQGALWRSGNGRGKAPAALLQRRWSGGDSGDDWYQQVLRLALRAVAGWSILEQAMEHCFREHSQHVNVVEIRDVRYSRRFSQGKRPLLLIFCLMISILFLISILCFSLFVSMHLF